MGVISKGGIIVFKKKAPVVLASTVITITRYFDLVTGVLTDLLYSIFILHKVIKYCNITPVYPWFQSLNSCSKLRNPKPIFNTRPEFTNLTEVLVLPRK